MPRTCLLLIAGLDHSLLEKIPNLPTLSSLQHRSSYQPPYPAVTCTTQATLTTGTYPSEHGIICNGLFPLRNTELLPHLDLTNHAEARKTVTFWEQSNDLLMAPRFWKDSGKKIAMLFWQNSIGAADIVLTPKPTHTPDVKTMTACFSSPPNLYPTLVSTLGPFPLHNYWSPMAGLPSSAWIAKSAEHVWQNHAPDLQLVYIPHLDYNLQRLGPNHPAILKDLQDLDALLAPLASLVRADGSNLIIAGDYGISDVNEPTLPNLALRKAGLLHTKEDANGKLLIDFQKSAAFAMVDHQIAHVYLKKGAEMPAVVTLFALDGVRKILHEPADLAAAHINNPRSGTLILRAAPNAHFLHDYWLNDDEKPAFQFTVDIHNKPGFDPRELFFDPQKKCIAQDPSLIKGSHGNIDDPLKNPVLLSTTPLPADLSTTTIAPWLKSLLTA